MPLLLRVPRTGDQGAIERALRSSAGSQEASRVLALLGRGSPALGAFDAQDRVLGLLVARAEPYSIRGESRSIGILSCAYFPAAVRLGGVHSLAVDLLAEFKARFEGSAGLVMLLARPTEADGWWLRRMAEFEPITTGLGLRRAGAWPIGVPAGVEVSRWTSHSNLRWDTPLSFTACAPRRDRAWAERLVSEEPDSELFVAARGEVVVCAAVARRRPHECRLLDWAAPAGDWPLVEALLSPLVGDASIPVTASLWNPTHWTAHALQEAGFVVDPRAGEPLLLGRISLGFLTRHFLAESLEEMELRVGISPLHTFTRPELVVTPPPAGDR